MFSKHCLFAAEIQLFKKINYLEDKISLLQRTTQYFGHCSWPVFTDDKNLTFDREVNKYLKCRYAVTVCTSRRGEVMHM